MMKAPSHALSVQTLLEATGILLAGVLLLAGLEVPAAPEVNLLFRVILFTGGMILLFFACGDALRPVARLRVLGYGSVALLVLLRMTAGALVQTPGEEEPVSASLTAIMWVAACCAILAAVGRGIAGKGAPDPAGTAAIPRMSARAPQPVSGEDRPFIAAHEAGHALMYAAWSPLPDQLQVEMKTRTDASGTLGYVRDGQIRPQLTEKTRAEWEMLLSLAGMAGEYSYTGTATTGAVNDSLRWLSVATPYLTCYPLEGVFYPQPATELELAANQRQLAELKAKQKALLTTFFTHNSDVHARLTDALLASDRLAGDALHPFLTAVQLPEGFPRIGNGPGEDPQASSHERKGP